MRTPLGIRIFLGAMFVFACATASVPSPAFCQDEDGSIIVDGDEVEYLTDQEKIRAKGNVVVVYGGSRLECDEIIVDAATKDAHCIGRVALYQDGNTIEGEDVVYNFDKNTGKIQNVVWAAPPLYGRARSCQIIARNHMRFTDGYISTCDLPRPHYKIKAKSFTVYPDNRIEASNVSVYAGRVPLVYIPQYSRSLKSGTRTSLSVIPGRNKKWGEFLLGSYKYDFTPDVWANLRLDYRYMLGLGDGVDVGYATQKVGKGLAKFYYTHERDRHEGEDRPGERERFRGQLRHTWNIDRFTQAFVEFHKMKDADFLKDYFYREEYERDPTPSSFISVIRNAPDYAAGIHARKRVNRFFSETEKLPEIKLNWRNHRIKDTGFYYTADSAFSNLTNKTAESGLDDDVVRFDASSKISYLKRLRHYCAFRPFVGLRHTAYSKDAFGDETRLRNYATAGIDATTRFHKTYDVTTRIGLLELNGIRHIITPVLRYEYVHEPTIPASQLQQFDSLDAVKMNDRVTLEVEHTFQTKREKDGQSAVVDIARFLTAADYHFGPREGSRLADVSADLEIFPADWCTLESDATYNPNTRDIEVWNLDFTLRPTDKWDVGLGTRYQQDTETELTTQIGYVINPKWSIRVYERFDFKEVESGIKRINRLKAQEYSITRDLHCWIMQLTYSREAEGGDTFWIVFKPKLFPRIPYRVENTYKSPFPKQ
ncbi:MAG: LPS-assembly protein LptD [Candidatus Omnitrophica bacterium]|nr:LPS-assembly protein LptD [Candidatus Omnitrophota bacterium]